MARADVMSSSERPGISSSHTLRELMNAVFACSSCMPTCQRFLTGGTPVIADCCSISVVAQPSEHFSIRAIQESSDTDGGTSSFLLPSPSPSSSPSTGLGALAAGASLIAAAVLAAATASRSIWSTCISSFWMLGSTSELCCSSDGRRFFGLAPAAPRTPTPMPGSSPSVAGAAPGAPAGVLASHFFPRLCPGGVGGAIFSSSWWHLENVQSAPGALRRKISRSLRSLSWMTRRTSGSERRRREPSMDASIFARGNTSSNSSSLSASGTDGTASVSSELGV